MHVWAMSDTRHCFRQTTVGENKCVLCINWRAVWGKRAIFVCWRKIYTFCLLIPLLHFMHVCDWHLQIVEPFSACNEHLENENRTCHRIFKIGFAKFSNQSVYLFIHHSFVCLFIHPPAKKCLTVEQVECVGIHKKTRILHVRAKKNPSSFPS